MRINSHLLLFITLIATTARAQQNRIKFGFMGLPLASEAGFGIGDIGYERLDKSLRKSWQIHFNASGGAIATDVGATTRKWLTVERTFYKNTIAKRITWSYSFFTEAGSRKQDAGYIHPPPEKIFNYTKVFEINPGAGIAIQYHLGKKWALEMQAGPKMIFASGKDYYYNSITKQYFTEAVNNAKAGFRAMGVVAFQF